jgi:15-cis-phytoene synthase
MRFQVARARALFDAADPVVALFPGDGSRLTVRLLQRTYAGILDGIERLGYDVFRARAYVSGSRNLVILGRALWSERPRGPTLSWARSA